jgi:hypothetical protein
MRPGGLILTHSCVSQLEEGFFMMDIFEFWSDMRHGETVHPADKPVFDRIGDQEKNGFKTHCLPACFSGRLRTADVVLLYLSPGYSKQDEKDVLSKEGRDYYFRKWKGDEPLRASGGEGEAWLRSRTKKFADYETVRNRFAILNIGAYHSKVVADYGTLCALPSSRVSLGWAQKVLFPAAEKGERLVICMRSAACWGLKTGESYGKSLFAPKVTRGGFLLQNAENQALIEKVHAKLRA